MATLMTILIMLPVFVGFASTAILVTDAMRRRDYFLSIALAGCGVFGVFGYGFAMVSAIGPLHLGTGIGTFIWSLCIPGIVIGWLNMLRNATRYLQKEHDIHLKYGLFLKGIYMPMLFGAVISVGFALLFSLLYIKQH